MQKSLLCSADLMHLVDMFLWPTRFDTQGT